MLILLGLGFITYSIVAIVFQDARAETPSGLSVGFHIGSIMLGAVFLAVALARRQIRKDEKRRR